MEPNSIVIDQQAFSLATTHFSFEWPYTEITHMAELGKLALFPQLESASFTSTNLNNEGLSHVVKAKNITNLCLQNTQITNGGLQHLTALKQLKILRLKENPQLTNACIPVLCALRQLEDLQLHETSVDEAGLALLEPLKSLRDVIVSEHHNKVTYNGMLRLSQAMPYCTFLVKGRGEFFFGKFDGEWE